MDTRHTRSTIDRADTEDVVEHVRERYANFATAGSACCAPVPDSCCGSSREVARFLGYAEVDLGLLPKGTNLGLGCGAPLEHLAPAAGETVLDLGSGAGIDVLIAARRVGESGRAIGVDMTPEMLEAARANAARAGIANVEFREGRLEHLPVANGSVDAVTSNCVINLVPDKRAVFAEVARVLRPGGRLVISDIVLDGVLPETVCSDVMAYVGCVAGAERRDEYFRMLTESGFGEVEVLKDVDFLEITGKAAPAELQALLESTGTDPAELTGIVRSVTYRATKR
jgi:SAM-dependent methyltransferase